MNHGIQIRTTGGPEVLEWAELDDPAPAEGGLVVDVEAAGLNFIDTYHRGGLYPMEVPFIPGVEGAGVVTAVGPGVDGFAEGDRVVWTAAIGSYARSRTLDASAAVKIPDGVDTKVAAAAMLQGLTAHYLSHDTFALSAGQRALVHAGAGGVGLLLTQMAKLQGAEVFTTVGSPEKAELSKDAGADHVILYREVDFAEAVESIAGERPIDVVYDGVGKSVFEASMGLLRRRGLMVTFGNASGPVDPVSPLDLMRGGSLFLTRPTLFDYVATRPELEARAAALFDLIASERLDVRIGDEYPLAEAAAAHRALESRRTTGKVLLVP